MCTITLFTSLRNILFSRGSIIQTTDFGEQAHYLVEFPKKLTGARIPRPASFLNQGILGTMKILPMAGRDAREPTDLHPSKFAFVRDYAARRPAVASKLERADTRADLCTRAARNSRLRGASTWRPASSTRADARVIKQNAATSTKGFREPSAPPCSLDPTNLHNATRVDSR